MPAFAFFVWELARPAEVETVSDVATRVSNAEIELDATTASAAAPERDVVATREPPPAEDSVARSRSRAARDALDQNRRLSSLFPPGNNANFDAVDMSELRRAIEQGHLTAQDLVDVLKEFGEDDPLLRPLVFAAFAYVPEVSAEQRAMLGDVAVEARILTDADANPQTRGRAEANAYAALFALDMLDASDALEHAIGGLGDALERRVPDSESSLRSVAMFALKGLDRIDDERTLAVVRGIVEAKGELGLTSAAWGALARSGNAVNVDFALKAALAGNGHAREGLESTNDPRSMALLADVVTSRDGGVYGNWLALSAAHGLLGLGTPESASAFENLAHSDDPKIGATLARALETPPPPTALGALLLTRWRTTAHVDEADGGLGGALDHAIESVCRRLERATVSRRDAAACCAGVRAVFEQGALHGGPLRTTCLRVLVLAGDEADRRFAEGLAQRMPEPDRELILEAVARRGR
ncbi:MAG: hypothetical protein K8S98_18025 [Planctomycetes bacterium]|nr:hypothetical protein [Planctomycetota bacterium]